MKSADDYRERPTGEILKEQSQLERLKQIAQTNGNAWWEWDAEIYNFRVSPGWEALTGYSAADAFPVIDKSVRVETLIDDFVEDWVSYAHPEDQSSLAKKLNKFIRFTHTSSCFEHGYRLRKADGSYILILSIACSVWIDGNLTRLFCQTRNIDQYQNAQKSAIAIVENKNQIEAASYKIELIESSIKAIAAVAPKIKPLMLAVISALGAIAVTGEQILNAVHQVWRSTFNVATVSESTQTKDDSTLIGKLDDESLAKIRTELRVLGGYGDRTILAIYNEGVFPSQYRIVMQAEKGTVMLTAAETLPRSTTETTFASTRTDMHVGDSPYTSVDGSTSIYSVPFTIKIDETHWHLGYVETTSTGLNGKQTAELQAAVRDAAANIGAIIQNAVAPTID